LIKEAGFKKNMQTNQGNGQKRSFYNNGFTGGNYFYLSK